MPNPHPRCVRDEGDARDLLAQARSSGLPLRTWCHTNGISPGSLYWWRTKLQSGGARRGRRCAAPEAVRVAEVCVPHTESPARPPSHYELELPNQVRIRLDEHFDATALERLLSVVSRC